MTPTVTQADDRCAFPQCDGVAAVRCDVPHDVEDDLPRPSSARQIPRRPIEQLAPMTGGTMARSIGSKVAGIQKLVDSITASQSEILIFGLAVPIVLGFIWLVLLRLFAKTFTYVMIIAIGCGMFALTLYAYILAGAAEELQKYLAANSTVVAPTGVSADDKAAANDEVAKALGLVDQANNAVAALAPSDLTAAVNAAETANPALWWVVAIIMTILTLAYTISMCAARKQIKIAVAIVKESSVVLKDRPAMMFFPLARWPSRSASYSTSS